MATEKPLIYSYNADLFLTPFFLTNASWWSNWTAMFQFVCKILQL